METLTLANHQSVSVDGFGTVLVHVNNQDIYLDVYVLEDTSHPLILGTEYLTKNSVVLDFRKQYPLSSKACIFATRRTVFSANSETIIFGNVRSSFPVGTQGICSSSAHLNRKQLIAAHSVGQISFNNLVPIKILNPSNTSVTIYKGKPLGEFHLLDNSWCVHTTSVGQPRTNAPCGDTLVSSCNSAKLADQHDKQNFLSYFNLDDSHLSDSEQLLLHDCLLDNKDIFVTDIDPSLGFTNIVEHQIHLKPNFQSKHQRPYRLTPEKKEVLRHQLNELLKQGIIVPVSEKEDVPITSPIVLVSKKKQPSQNGRDTTKRNSLSSYRFCVDYRYLNSQTQEFRYTIPDVNELTESFAQRQPNYISQIDLSSGFFQMKLSPRSSKYTAFNTCYGTYKFLRLPQGLKTASNSFQLLMDKVLAGLSYKSVLCYLDDCVIISETFTQHLRDLQEVFDRLRSAGLKLSPKKCSFAQEKCVFLGHEISRQGVRPPADRLKVIENYPLPTNRKQLQRFLGLMNWFRKYIRNFSAIASCLYKLLKKEVVFEWTKTCQSAFDKLKDLLIHSEALSFPRYDLPFRIAVDTSSHGIGYMLYQEHSVPGENKLVPKVVRFGSRSLSKWQRSYGPTKLELLGVVTSILDCASYVRGRKFYVECDHQALKPVFQKNLKGAIYERWLAILQEFDAEISYRPAAEMVVPDALSRCFPNPAADSLGSSPDENDPFFPYVSENCGEIQFSSNLKQPTIQAITTAEANVLEQQSSDYDGDTEVADLHLTTKRRNKRLRDFRNKTNDAVTYDNSPSAMTSSDQYESSNTKTHLSSTETVSDNVAASKADLSSQAKNIELFSRFNYSPMDIARLQQNDPMLSGIYEYLNSGNLPRSQKKARNILLRAHDYDIIDGLLFHSRVSKSKRSQLFRNYQLAVPEVMINTILKIYHDLPMSGHAGINETLDRIKDNYFFHQMSQKVTDYVRSCDQCQKRKMTKMHTKSGITAYRTPSEPFQVWQIDLYGPLPLTPQGYSFVLTATCMFSKYLVTIPLQNKDTVSVAAGLTQLFTKYGVCDSLISDLGTEFASKCMESVCRQLGIKQDFTPSFSHHCLGACERIHRTIAERLTPYVENNRMSWMESLPFVTFSINQSVNAGLGYSPHEIIYGQRPKFPLSAPLPENYETIPPDMRTYVQRHADRLNIIRTEIKGSATRSKEKMLERVNRHTNALSLSPGDFVYLRTDIKGIGQKLQSNYTGPFVVVSLSSPHLAVLKNPETGNMLKNPIHLDRLKMAYVRVPAPQSFFEPKVVTKTKISEEQDTSGNVQTQLVSRPTETKQPRRSDRRKKKPEKYGVFVNPSELSASDETSLLANKSGYYKIKRVLGRRKTNNVTEYLIQFAGEPAENALWLPFENLNARLQQSVLEKPPKLVG